MMEQVKKTFKPEFINRLSGTVIFHDMDMHMAELIFDKKIRLLSQKLAAKSITLTLSSEARTRLIQQGYTKKFGAREMDRVITKELNSLLMHEILFGKLKKGGNVTIDYNEGFKLSVKS